MRPVNFEVNSKDDGQSYYILDTEKQKYFNWRYRTYNAAFTVSEYMRKLWNECPLDRVRDSRNYFSNILERTQLTDIELSQIHEQWVPGFSHNTYERSGF